MRSVTKATPSSPVMRESAISMSPVMAAATRSAATKRPMATGCRVGGAARSIGAFAGSGSRVVRGAGGGALVAGGWAEPEAGTVSRAQPIGAMQASASAAAAKRRVRSKGGVRREECVRMIVARRSMRVRVGPGLRRGRELGRALAEDAQAFLRAPAALFGGFGILLPRDRARQRVAAAVQAQRRPREGLQWIRRRAGGHAGTAFAKQRAGRQPIGRDLLQPHRQPAHV